MLGATGFVLGLLGLLVHQQPTERLRPWLGPAGALLLAAGGLVLLLTGSHPALGRALFVLGAVWGLFCLARWPLLTRATGRAALALTRPGWQWLALLAISPIAVLASRPFHSGSTPSMPTLRVLRTAAPTDKRREVRICLVTSETTASPALLATEQASLREWGLLGQVLQTAPADHGYDCHGWVFGGGTCLLAAEDVPLILADNGYHQVTDPQPSDFVLYRDDQAKVCHSGVVRLADDSGLILVESKWGWMGRYLHRPEAQPYGTHWTYYRSARAGHVLHDLPSVPPRASAGSPRPRSFPAPPDGRGPSPSPPLRVPVQ
jgi:hypothetical protein